MEWRKWQWAWKIMKLQVQTICWQSVLDIVWMRKNTKITEIVTKVWEGKERSSRWKKGIICPLCGKGEKMYCTDFMVVTLYIVAYWTLSRVLHTGHVLLVCIVSYFSAQCSISRDPEVLARCAWCQTKYHAAICRFNPQKWTLSYICWWHIKNNSWKI